MSHRMRLLLAGLLVAAASTSGCIRDITHPSEDAGCSTCDDAGHVEPDGGKPATLCADDLPVLTVSATPQTHALDLTGASDVDRGTCGPSGAVDHVLRLETSERGILFVRAAADAQVPSLHLRSACDDASTERAGSCAPTAEAGAQTLLMVPVEAGGHHLWLEAPEAGLVRLEIWLDVSVESCGAGPVLSVIPPKLQLVGTTRGLSHTSPFGSSCTAARGSELDVRVRIEAATEIELDLEVPDGAPVVTASIRGALCGDELACTFSAIGGEAQYQHAALPGAYTLFFSSVAGDDADFRAVLSTTPSTRGDSCEDPQPLDLRPQGGIVGFAQVKGSTVGRADDHRAGCDGVEGPDAVYSFTTTETLSLQALVEGAAPFSVTLRGAGCDDDTATRACSSNVLTAGTLPPGTWHLLVEGPAEGGDFTLTLQLRRPDHGESCTDPLWLPLALAPGSSSDRLIGVASIDFHARHSDHRLACGEDGDRDAVVAFTTTEPRDLQVTFPVLSPVPVVAELMSGVCGALQWCGENGEGTQALVLERAALPAGDHVLRLARRGEPQPGEPASELSMNLFLPGDRCFGAESVHGAGVHVLQGTTVGYRADVSHACGSGAPGPDRAYRITLTEPGAIRVVLQSNDPGYQPLLSLHSGGCQPMNYYGCGFAGPGSTAQLEQENLAPGTYTLWVAGASGSSGRFTLTITVD